MSLSDNDIQTIKLGEALDKDYFYIPMITARVSKDYEDKIYSLRFSEIKPPQSLIQYASKVDSGKTLWEAVRYDLYKDFNYPKDKSFLIEYVWDYDTAKNKQGQELSRVLILVEVFHKFDTKLIKPVGFSPHWEFEDYDGPIHPINKYL
jgi:hypothetical protein